MGVKTCSFTGNYFIMYKYIFSLLFQKLRDLHDAWIETLYNNGTLEDRSGETIFNGFKV